MCTAFYHLWTGRAFLIPFDLYHSLRGDQCGDCDLIAQMRVLEPREGSSLLKVTQFVNGRASSSRLGWRMRSVVYRARPDQLHMQLDCSLATPVLLKTRLWRNNPECCFKPLLYLYLYSEPIPPLGAGQRNFSLRCGVRLITPCFCPRTTSMGFPAAPFPAWSAYRKAHVFWVPATGWRCSPSHEKSSPSPGLLFSGSSMN